MSRWKLCEEGLAGEPCKWMIRFESGEEFDFTHIFVPDMDEVTYSNLVNARHKGWQVPSTAPSFAVHVLHPEPLISNEPLDLM